MKRATWFVLFLLMGVSCLDQPDCFRQNLNLIGISFKKLHDGKADTIALLKLSANGYDSVFYERILTTNVSLPLNYLQNETEFLFQTLKDGYQNQTLHDYFLRLSHESKAQFVSEECGQRFVISNLKTVDDNFDSTRVASTSPSNPAPNNIIIYRCPRTNIMRLSFRQLYMDAEVRGRVDSRQIDIITTPSRPLYAATTTSPLTLSTVLLPLDENATTSTYNFKFVDGETRTVTFKYEKQDKTILDVCNKQVVFDKLENTNSTFEFIKVLNDSIYDPPITNVETYRCPTTNQIRVSFKTQQGSSKVNKQVLIKTLTANYQATVLYQDSTTTSVTLPLNPSTSATSTTFTIDIDGLGVKTLQVDYSIAEKTFHELCGPQPVFTTLTIPTTPDITFQPTVLINNVQFPTVENIEILL